MISAFHTSQQDNESLRIFFYFFACVIYVIYVQHKPQIL